MAKLKPQFLCAECGDVFPKWLGKCPSCEAFNSIKEFREAKLKTEGGKKMEAGIDLKSNPVETLQCNVSTKRIKTNLSEVDRVLGDGFFPHSVTLFGGHPGIGKSTLSLQIFLNLDNAFYFSGEESRDQVMNRAERLQANLVETRLIASLRDKIFSTNSLEDIVATLETHKPTFAVIDSIQMIGSADTSFGSMSQIRENAEVLIKLAKNTGVTILLIGHVTKNDELAGPKMLEHLVDTVLYLEGERNSEIRLLRSTKNRFGSTMEVGVFEMQASGLRELMNPSEFFLSERAENAFGSTISVIREGARNFLMEIQCLTVKTNFGQPRRTSHGMDLSKLHLLLAVVSKFTPFACENHDAYLNVVGGLKIKDPAADLAVVASILSSRSEKEIDPRTVIFGEVGLSGEIRRVANMEARIREIHKLGFQKIICPRLPKGLSLPDKIELKEVKTITDLMKTILKK